jgi:hypothetical protein
MATLRRHRAASGQQVQLVARLNRSQFEKHSHASGVQALITRARKTWISRYGFDPAAERLKDHR